MAPSASDNIELEAGKSGTAAALIPQPKSKTLAKMRENPRGDWQISDIEKVCNNLGLVITTPSNGSHYKVSSRLLDGILTVPARRPVKVPYIKMFVSLCDAHLESGAKEDSDG